MSGNKHVLQLKLCNYHKNSEKVRRAGGMRALINVTQTVQPYEIVLNYLTSVLVNPQSNLTHHYKLHLVNCKHVSNFLHYQISGMVIKYLYAD